MYKSDGLESREDQRFEIKVKSHYSYLAYS